MPNHDTLPVPADGIYHSKAGIIEDKVGDRIAFSGSINVTDSSFDTEVLGSDVPVVVDF